MVKHIIMEDCTCVIQVMNGETHRNGRLYMCDSGSKQLILS